jgi:tRNA(adenine34) deaminase
MVAPNHDQYMRVALEEAAKAGRAGNIAVGSVVVLNGEIAGRGHSQASSAPDPTAHAETAAMRDARRDLSRAELSGTVLYTTYEPCPMCCGAIMLTGVSTLVMGARQPAGGGRFGSYSVDKVLALAGWNDRITIVDGVLTEECQRLLDGWRAKNTPTPN